MKGNRPDLVGVFLIFMALALLSGLTWANYRFAVENPGGNDFIARWIGTRSFILDRASPYSDQTTDEIQDFFYGRPAKGDEDLQLFVYPHYSMSIFAPFALIADYPVARSLWMTTLEISLIGIAIISLAITGWRPTMLVFATLLLFSVAWYHGFRPLINGNASVLIALFITLAFLFIQTGRDRAAGIFLALSTIKPQMVILVIPLIMVWAISNRRWKLLVAFGVSMVILIGGSMLIQPDWIVKNLQQVLFYPRYTEPGTPGLIFSVWWPDIGRNLGLLLTGVLAVVLILEWVAVWGKGFRGLFWAGCITLVITNLIGIRTATSNYIALFPAITLVFSIWNQRWGRRGQWLGVSFGITLFFGLWILFIRTVAPGAGDQPVQHSIMFFPLPLILLVSLYWVRWWAVQPLRLEDTQNSLYK